MPDRYAETLAQAVELERRDIALAEAISTVVGLEERVGAIRRRAAEIATALARLPGDLESTDVALAAAADDERSARETLGLAERRVADLESARRRKAEELDQARRELARAKDALTDAQARIARHEARREELRTGEVALRAEADGLLVVARDVAAELSTSTRVPAVAAVVASETLEEWGAEARAGLFLARSGLETERQRVVEEANALGAAVLGEPLGASSAALVRRRIEAESGTSRPG